MSRGRGQRSGPALRIIITALCLCRETAAGNWPQWRGPHANGSAQEAGLPISWSATNNVVWRLELPEPGNSSPIVWEDRVFVTQAAGKRRTVMCIDRRNGALLWTAGPTYEEPELTMTESNPFCAASPVTDGKRVIAHFGSAGLYCFDFKGKELWHADTGKISHILGSASSPCLDGDRVFVFVGPGAATNEWMVAVDKRNGKVLWRSPAWQQTAEELAKAPMNGPPIGSWATPLSINHDGRKEIAMAFGFRLCSYDWDTGKMNWQQDGLGLQTYVTPLWTDGMLVAQSGTTMLAARPPTRPGENAETVWTQTKSKFRFASSVATKDHLFSLSENGFAECWEKATGKIVWQERLQGPGKKMPSWSSLSMSGNLIYAPNQSGDVFVFAAEPTFRLLSTNSVGESTNATLALAEGNVIVRTDRALWCFGIPNSKRAG